MIDIIEQEIADMDEELFNTLLFDRTTRQNICWASDNYTDYGVGYAPENPITKELVTGLNTKIIQPRAAKDSAAQIRRTKETAEVFTPLWICNAQLNLVDAEWFGRRNVFNIDLGKSWRTTKGNIEFPAKKSWQQYVDDKRLELTCGEAPYIVTRYDPVSGEELSLAERIGLLDRKIRVVNENTTTEEDWLHWIARAYEATYGYEYQGDSLLIARENLLYTFIEHMEARYHHAPTAREIQRIARIISWNIWQMDGLTYTAPFSEREIVGTQQSLFAATEVEREPIPCRIHDWRDKRTIEFREMLREG